LEGIVNVQKEMSEERKHARSKEMEENWLVEERKAAIDERLAATEKREGVNRGEEGDNGRNSRSHGIREESFLHGYKQSR
jgi:hypothetical protein